MKLSPKLILLVLLSTLLPLGLAIGLAYSSGRHWIEQVTWDHLQSITALREAEFNRWMEANSRSLRDLAQRPLLSRYSEVLTQTKKGSPTFQSAYEAALWDHLRPNLTARGGFSDLFLMRPQDGLIVLSTDSKLEGAFRENQMYFIEGSKGLYVQNVYYAINLGKPVITIAIPILDDGGFVTAVLAGHLDLDEVASILVSGQISRSSEYSYLINQFHFQLTQGRQESDQISPLIQANSVVYTQGVDECLAGRTGVGIYEDGAGTMVLGAFRWMPERDLCLLTEVDRDEALRPVIQLRNALLLIGLGTGFLALVVSVFVSRGLLRPVRRLLDGVQAFEGGNWDRPIGSTTSDELGALSRSFDRMAATRLQMERELRSAHDGLEQRVAERTAELAVSEARYRALAEASQDMILVIDQAHRVAYVNDFAARQFGSTAHDLIGLPESDLFPEEGSHGLGQAIQRVLENGQASVLEHQARFAVRQLWLSTWLAPLEDSQGNIWGVMGVFRDITERKESEEALRRLTEDLTRSNAELEQFAYVASHDLQEPLRMVASYLQLIERRYHDRLDSDGLEFIHFAVDGATRMKVLINDLLALSRVSTHHRELALVDANQVVADVQVQLDLMLKEKNAKLWVGPLPMVMADPVQLSQLFQNLISNGVKYQREEEAPTIRIWARELTVDAGMWQFSVQDNGIGVDSQYFDRIFVIFQRLHTRDQYGGTGIGLAISKRIVERHGGRIWIESTLGAGSTFHFTLPAVSISSG